jgi:hypothetical protein
MAKYFDRSGQIIYSMRYRSLATAEVGNAAFAALRSDLR